MLALGVEIGQAALGCLDLLVQRDADAGAAQGFREQEVFEAALAFQLGFTGPDGAACFADAPRCAISAACLPLHVTGAR